MIYIQKLIRNKEQFSVTIPKGLVKTLGISNYRVVMVSSTDNKTITIERYDAEKINRAGSKTD